MYIGRNDQNLKKWVLLLLFSSVFYCQFFFFFSFFITGNEKLTNEKLSGYNVIFDSLAPPTFWKYSIYAVKCVGVLSISSLSF